jgi:WD40 repeat protein/tRNA A-37 threonylcarbamoyl transferase component Bud32
MNDSARPASASTPQIGADSSRQERLRDLQERWAHGERLRVETYLQREPALAEDTEGILELLYQEMVLRDRHQDPPRLEEYLRRFPRLAEPLTVQFEVFEALRAGWSGVSLAPPQALEGAAAVPQIAGFEVQYQVGRGGMGVVYRARQRSLNRTVAVKMIRTLAAATARERARFRAEAEAAAGLQHPAIVQVFEVGESSDGPYLVLEFLEGGSLSRKLAGVPMPPRQAAEMLLLLANAVSAAHARGIVHRDLKPANILLTASGLPKIVDFGLAKNLQRDGSTGTNAAGLTQVGDVVGTPSYMAPEQTGGESEGEGEGQVQAIGPWTDVYALGAILYELLTGRPPFRGATALDTLEQVRDREPVPPRRLQPSVPIDLETICLTCLRKEPAKRYASSQALAEDVGHFVAGEPIRARPAGRWERLVKWARRRPAAAALVAVSMTATAVVVAGLVIGLLMLGDKQEETQNALSAAQVAGKAKDDALQVKDAALRAKETALAQKEAALRQERLTGYYNRIARAYGELLSNNVVRARKTLAECPDELRHWEWRYLQRSSHAELVTLAREGSSGKSVAFSPDDQLLAVGHDDGSISVWDVNAGKMLYRAPGESGAAVCVAFSGDGTRLASGSRYGKFGMLTVLEARSGKLVRRIAAHKAGVRGLAFDPSGEKILTCGGEPTVRAWDLMRREVVAWQDYASPVNCVAWSHDGLSIATGHEDGMVQILSTETGKAVHKLQGHSKLVLWLAFQPGDKKLLSSTVEEVRTWDTNKGIELPGRLTRYSVNAALSSDGQHLALAAIRVAWVVTADKGLPHSHYCGDTDSVSALAFNRAGDRLATVCLRGSITLWDATSPPEFTVLHRIELLAGLALNDQQQQLAYVSSRDAGLLDLRKRRAIWQVPWQPRPPLSEWPLALHSDSNQLASADKTAVIVMDAATGAELRRFLLKDFFVNGMAYDPAGRVLAVAGSSGPYQAGAVLLLDATSGATLRKLPGDSEVSLQVSFGRDGRHLATLTKGNVQLWKADGSELRFTLNGQLSTGRFYHSAVFSPDGRLLAAGSRQAVDIVNVADGKLVHTLTSPNEGNPTRGLAFTPDGARLVGMTMVGEYSNLVVWDMSTGQELLTLRAPYARINDLAFTADGHRLVGAVPGAIVCWDGTPLLPGK